MGEVIPYMRRFTRLALVCPKASFVATAASEFNGIWFRDTSGTRYTIRPEFCGVVIGRGWMDGIDYAVVQFGETEGEMIVFASDENLERAG